MKYKIMIGAHSLLLEHKKKNKDSNNDFEEWENEERIRFAVIATMMAEEFAFSNNQNPEITM